MPVSSKTFFSTWQHALQSDFTKDGQPATYFPDHPKHWGSETAQVDLERSLALSLSDDGNLLGASDADGGVRIYDFPSFTLWRTLKGPRSCSSGSVRFQPGRGKSGKVLVGGELVQGDEWRRWIKSYELKNDDDTEDLFKQAAGVAASAAVETISKSVSKENIDHTKIRDDFWDTLFEVQLDLGIGDDIFEGSLVGGRAFSRDGSFFLFSKDDNTIVVLDSESFQERYTLVGHTDYVVWAETSPDDTVIATSSWDQTVRVWDSTNGQQLQVLTGATCQSWSGAFSPDGKLVCAGCGDSKVRVWDVESGELLHTLGGFQRWVRSVAFSPDGKSLAGGSESGVLKVFDVVSGKEKQHWEVKKTIPFRSSFIEVRSVHYTSKGLLVFNYGDGRVHTYDEKTNQKGLYEHGPEIPSSAGYGTKLITPDGKLLISADFDRCIIRIWNLE
ncbi:hypothetical protein VKT23_008505 [Stygiomarasmius scandens]|uniref:WD40 repeat-like protein n=1 Tax=Marasmiellus scandens TaxID=2682957 RepID=A0ABR1JHI1_9AGAR